MLAFKCLLCVLRSNFLLVIAKLLPEKFWDMNSMFHSFTSLEGPLGNFENLTNPSNLGSSLVEFFMLEQFCSSKPCGRPSIVEIYEKFKK